MLRKIIIVCCFCVTVSVITCGCAPKSPSGTVSGTVTYKNKPVDVGYVLLMSPDKIHLASGPLDGEGRYRLTEPLPPGEYRVAISPPPSPDSDTEPPPKKSPVPKRYHSAEESSLSFTVVEGPNTADFDLN